MARTTMCARNPEELQKTINSFKEGSKIQAKIIKEKNKEIKELAQKNLSLSAELKRVSCELKRLKASYQELYYDSFKKY